MPVVVITKPDQVVSTVDAKAHLRVDAPDEDDLIEALVLAATGNIDGPDGWLGRAIGLQTLELRQDGFLCSRIPLPYPPILTIVSVAYDDANGVRQILDPALYSLKDGAACLAHGAAWPAYRSGPDSVAVQFTAGYADGDLPAPIRAAILLRVGDLHANREALVIGAGTVSMIENRTVDLLLSPFRVWAT